MGEIESEKSWGIGARYERRLIRHLGGFLGQFLEADPFAASGTTDGQVFTSHDNGATWTTVGPLTSSRSETERFVERMDQNEDIFVRFMNDPANVRRGHGAYIEMARVGATGPGFSTALRWEQAFPTGARRWCCRNRVEAPGSASPTARSPASRHRPHRSPSAAAAAPPSAISAPA